MCTFCTLFFKWDFELLPRVTYFKGRWLFIFHVSECIYNCLIIKTFSRWNLKPNASGLISSFQCVFLPLCFAIACSKKWNLLHQVSFLIVSACKMKHWKQKWNIQRVCFMLWNAYKSIVFVQKVKHWNMRSRAICVIISCNLSNTMLHVKSSLNYY